MIELLLKYPPVLKDAGKSTIYRCFLPHRCQCLEDFPTDRTMFGSAGRGSWVGFFWIPGTSVAGVKKWICEIRSI